MPALADVDPQLARLIVERALERGGGWLTPVEANALRRRGRHHGAAIDAGDVGRSRRWRRPRASDIRSRSRPSAPALLHKTEHKAVRLNLQTRAEVRLAASELVRSLGDKIEGLLVQRMVGGGAEMMIGAINDPTFGHVIVCGSGGVLIELLADSSCRLCPVTDQDAAEMVAGAQGRAAPARVPRQRAALDEAAFRDAVLRVSALVDICPEIQELDVNPLAVLADGVSALDVRVRVAANAHQPVA